jgi:predicted ATPase
VGREIDTIALRDILGRARLVTLTGVGGSGKTRLGIHLAEAVVRSFPDGLWYVELAAVTDASLVPSAIAKVLGLREEGHRRLVETIQDFLRPRAPLLILDNCEHVLATVGPLVAALLRSCPKLKVLATSRHLLQISGETQWPVDGLPTAGQLEADQSSGGRLASAASSDAVALFVERAQALQPDFALSPDNVLDVVEVCRRLDGLPLAIELAANQIQTLSISAVLEGLGRRFDLLSEGVRDLPPRQQTLRAAIDWSFDLLSSRDRGVFCRLCVFVGSFDSAAAASLCRDLLGSAGGLDEIIQSLLITSLVRPVTFGRERRFTILETLREYGLRRLDALGEHRTAAHAHAQYFADLVDDKLPLPAHWTRPNLTKQFGDDAGNVWAALDWLNANEQGELATRLAGSLLHFWVDERSVGQGLDRVADVLARHDNIHPASRAKLVAVAAILSFILGDYQAAADYAAASAATFRAIGDVTSAARILGLQGISLNEQSDYLRARPLFDEAIAILRRSSDQNGLVETIAFAADAAIGEEDYARAHALLGEGLALARERLQWSDVAYIEWNRARLALDDGDFSRAKQLFQDSLALSRRHNVIGRIALCALGLGYVAIHERNLTEARQQIIEGFRLSHQVGFLMGIHYALDHFAILADADGQPLYAAQLAGASTTLRQAARSARHPIWLRLLRKVGVSLDRPSIPTLAGPWDEGSRLTLEQAIALALHDNESDTTLHPKKR